MNLARFLFYILLYLMALASGPDLIIFILTFPIFFAVLFCVSYERSERVGYIDAVSAVYFVSFVVVPLQQIRDQVFVAGELQGGIRYPDTYFAIVAALALFSYAALIYAVRPAVAFFRKRNAEVVAPAWALIAIGIVFASIAVLGFGSVENLHASRYARSSDLDSSIAIATTAMVVPALSINAAFAVLRCDSNSIRKWLTVIATCSLLFFVANPWNAARYFLLAAWLPVIVCLMPKVLRPGIFYFSVIFVAIVGMPILSITTRFSENRIDTINQLFLGQDSIFSIRYFNIFEMSCEAMRYVERYGNEHGTIFISTIFSAVPRIIWPDKPIHSAFLIGDMNLAEGFGNRNLAIPWFMDGYIDFGIVGSIIYSLFFLAFFRFAIYLFKFRINNIDLYGVIFFSNISILIRGTLAVTMYSFIFQVIYLILFSLFFVRKDVGVIAREGQSSKGAVRARRRLHLRRQLRPMKLS